MRKRVSFDYDGCLGHIDLVALIARAHQWAGHEVYILTYRGKEGNGNEDVYATAEELSIPAENVLFAMGTTKTAEIVRLGIKVHYDDDLFEVHTINSAKVNCLAVCVNYTHDRSNIYDATGLDEDIKILS